MAGEAVALREFFADVGDALKVAGGGGVVRREVAIEEKVGLEGREAMAGAKDKLKIWPGRAAGIGEPSFEIDICDVDAVASAPVAEDVGLDVGGLKGALEEEIVLQVNLGDGEVVAKTNAPFDLVDTIAQPVHMIILAQKDTNSSVFR